MSELETITETLIRIRKLGERYHMDADDKTLLDEVVEMIHSFEPIRIGDIGASFTFTMTTNQSEFVIPLFAATRLIAKIPTSKGDFYAPVKSYRDGKIILEMIPEDEDEMWRMSELWKRRLGQGDDVS